MDRKGFTLVELMIVVAILGILAAIAVPLYHGYIGESIRSEARSNLQTIRLLEEQFYADNKVYKAGATTDALADPSTGLPGFQPGDTANLKYDYKVEFKSGNNQTFTATATPKSGRAPAGNFTIDESNAKTGQW